MLTLIFYISAFTTLTGSLAGDATPFFISRKTVLTDMVALYSDPQIPTKGVHVTFLGEEGQDVGGLTKDLFTLTWREILQEYFQGEEAVVPFVPPYKKAASLPTFRAIGGIMSHTAALLKSLPPRISRTTIMQLIYGDDMGVDEDLLLDDFG